VKGAVQPTRAWIEAAPAGAWIPVYRAVPADTETPVSVFLKLRSGGTGFLLESAEQDGSLGRFSFVGAMPDAVLRADDRGARVTTTAGTTAVATSPLGALRQFVGTAPLHADGMEVPGFLGGVVGALGYDLGRSLENLAARIPDGAAVPVALFARYDTVVVFDHLKQQLAVVSLMPPDVPRGPAYETARDRVDATLDRLRTAPAPGWFDPSGDPADPDRLAGAVRRQPADDDFLTAVSRAREYIHAGDAIQVVLSRRLEIPFDGDPFRLYRALRTINPSPYMFFLEFPELAVVGSSPEMLLRVEGSAAQLAPIAGTRPRGAGADADAALEADLLGDAKERAEHVMLVDLGRNDLGRVCRAGSVHVPRFMQVERYSHVMHLVSSVTGRLADGVDALDALAACFPAGTLSGAPKVRAMEIIEELETVRRGLYGGAVGYAGFGGRSLDTCIAIRTVVIRDGTAHLQVGAGIVADSDPHRELEETNSKARAMLAALAMAGTGAGSAGTAPRTAEQPA
jgi:anthranilate synthase component I